MSPTERFISEMLLGFVACLLLIVAMHRVANAAECVEPTTACAALLADIDATCERTPNLCRLNPDRYAAIENCNRIDKAARIERAPILLALVTAYRESGLDPFLVSSVGARGMMQVIPRYWCPADTSCDLDRAGARALAQLVERHGMTGGVAFYRGGYRALRSDDGLEGAQGRVDAAKRIKRGMI